MNKERENYSWGIIQDMIEREISAAFKLREPSQKKKKENEQDLCTGDHYIHRSINHNYT